MEIIDTHSHMYLPHFVEDLEDCMQRATEKSVSKIILPNIDSKTIPLIDEMAEVFPDQCIPLMGLHPTHVKDDYESELEIIFKQLEAKKYFGIGEIGIDLYWDKTYFDQQKDAFEMQVAYAMKHEFPFIIHARNSFNEIFEVLKSLNHKDFNGIFHAFTGTVKEAEFIIEMGFKIGIGGILTFKNSGLADTVKFIDINHIVLETDSPYLAPVPYRGKRNESSYLPHIASKLAEIKNESFEKVAEITSQNAIELFRL